MSDIKKAFKWNGQRDTVIEFQKKLRTEAAMNDCLEILDGQLADPDTFPKIIINNEDPDPKMLQLAAHYDKKRSQYVGDSKLPLVLMQGYLMDLLREDVY